MNSSNVLTVGSVFYSILLMFLFFSKRRIKTVENKIYTRIIILNFFGLISAILCYYTVSNYKELGIINEIVARLYLVYLVAFILLFFYYLVVTLYSVDDKISKRVKAFKYILYTSLFIVSVAIYLLPLYYSNDAVYSYGPAANIVYILATLCMTAWVLLLAINYKKVKSRKFIPIIFFIIGSALVTIVQKINPQLLLMTSMETFITFIMFHTIENPDIEIIEELQKANEISNNSNQEKSMFLYDTAQSVRKPLKDLNDGINYIEDLDNINEIKQMLKELKTPIRDITNKVNNVMDISDIEASKMNVEYNWYNIRNVLEKSALILKNNLNNKNIKTDVKIPTDLPELLYGDSIRLSQVLNIVLNNAIKYTEEGSISFETNTIFKNNVCRLIITVEDTGCGISSEKIEEIMNKTKKLSPKELEEMDESIKHVEMAKTVTALIGGTLIIDSKVNVGTKITIVLDQNIKEQSTTLDKFNKKYQKAKVLLVDDDPKTLDKETKKLLEYDINIETVTSGESCLVKSRRKEQYDLIIIKEDMEKLNGIDTLKKLKTIEDFKTPVIVLTKEKEEISLNALKQIGFADYLEIPIKTKELDGIINKYLGI